VQFLGVEKRFHTAWTRTGHCVARQYALNATNVEG
jgi:hypothetical protein